MRDAERTYHKLKNRSFFNDAFHTRAYRPGEEETASTDLNASASVMAFPTLNGPVVQGEVDLTSPVRGDVALPEECEYFDWFDQVNHNDAS